MIKPPFLLILPMLVAGCVTNISAKAAEKCAPVQGTAFYEECIQGTQAEMRAKNRNTARILAAGLAGAAHSTPTNSFAPVGYLKSNFVSGNNRICVYDKMGSAEYVTILAVQICPISH